MPVGQSYRRHHWTALRTPEFINRSSFARQGNCKAGYGVTATDQVIEAKPLPVGTSTQNAEISALTRTLQMPKGLLLETCCFLPDFFLDLLGTRTFLLPKTNHAVAVLPLCFCPGPSERRATGLLLDLGGDYPCFTQFLLLSFLFYHPPSLPHHPNL